LENNCFNRNFIKSIDVKNFEEVDIESITSKDTPASHEVTDRVVDQIGQIDQEEPYLDHPSDNYEESLPSTEQSKDEESNTEQVDSSPVKKNSKKVTTIIVSHNKKEATLLLDRVDNEDGYAWIQYNASSEQSRVDVGELSILYVGC
jgi:hypothetical protein